VQSISAKDTGAIGVEKWSGHEVADLDLANFSAHGLDNADELVPHTAASLAVFHRLVRP
jgi:hypothetical protein